MTQSPVRPRAAATAGPVVTVTPNPSLDHTVEISVLVRGEVQRTSQALVEAGGKGVNVARALAKHGHATTAILPAGDDAQRMIGLLTPQQVSTVAVPIAGAIRTNIAVVEKDGTTTKLNEPGATLSEAEVAALIAAVNEALAAGPSWLVAAGSLPAGAPDDFYAQVTKAAVAVGVPVAIDTSGPALAAAIDAGATVVKPNLEELEEVLGRDLVTVGDVIDAAAELRERGSKDLLVSLGGHGALLITAEGSWWAGGPPLVPAEHRRSRRLHAVRLPAHRRHPRRAIWPGRWPGVGPPACSPAAPFPAPKTPKPAPTRSASSPIPIPSKQ